MRGIRSSTVQICFIFVLSCSVPDNIELSGTAIGVPTTITDTGIQLSSFINELRYVPLDDGGGTLMNRVDKLDIVNGVIYILQKHHNPRLLQFDSNGAFLRMISDVGRGPGEFQAPEDFVVTEDHVFIYDRVRLVVIKYDLLFNFIDEYTVPFRAEAMSYNPVEKSFLFFCNNIANPSSSLANYNLIITDQQFKPIRRALEINPVYRNLHFGSKLFFQRTDEGILLQTPFHDTIYRITWNNEVELFARIDFGTYSMNYTDLFSQYSSNSERIQIMQQRDAFRNIQSFVYANGKLLFWANKLNTIYYGIGDMDNIHMTSQVINDVDTLFEFGYIYSVNKNELIFVKESMCCDNNISELNQESSFITVVFASIKE